MNELLSLFSGNRSVWDLLPKIICGATGVLASSVLFLRITPAILRNRDEETDAINHAHGFFTHFAIIVCSTPLTSPHQNIDIAVKHLYQAAYDREPTTQELQAVVTNLDLQSKSMTLQSVINGRLETIRSKLKTLYRWEALLLSLVLASQLLLVFIV